jgi:hypothetical protein
MPKQLVAPPASLEIKDNSGASKTIPWSQSRRLQFIDFRLQWDQKLNRSDLRSFFTISVPQASADIAQYISLAPENLLYDRGSRMYIAGPKFKALYPSSGARQYLSQLLALDRGVVGPSQSFVGFKPEIDSVPLPSRHIDTKTLLPILRAIGEKAKIEARYQSITRNEPQWRSISPHAFGHDGLRWHVRAFCHLRNGFRDFIVGRILEVGATSASEVVAEADAEWHQQVELVLEPHPELSGEQRIGVETDFGMLRGQVTLKCRRAMLYYTLRSLNFESTGMPRRGEHQLVIANLEAIKSLLPIQGQA